MKKRTKIIISSLLLAIVFFAINSFPSLPRLWGLLILSLVALGATVFSLWGELRRVEFLTVLTLPAFFTAGLGLFYFLLPVDWYVRAAAALIYGAGMYILLLTENIYSVANTRNIQLLRAAQATGFLLTLVTTFFIFDAVYSYRLPAWQNGLFVWGLSWLIFFQGLWMIPLGEKFSWSLFSLAGGLGLVLAEGGLAISFMPMTVSSASLFLTAGMYVLLGLGQAHLQERLFKKTVREYLWIGLLVLVTILLTTKWG